MFGNSVNMHYLCQNYKLLNMNWDYISGFFDADGSVVLVSPKPGANKTLYVCFHNNEINILEEIKDFIHKELNITGTIIKKTSKNIKHENSFELRYMRVNALKVAEKMNILHIKKIHRIKTYLIIQKLTKRNGKYSEKELFNRNFFVEQFFKH